MPTPCAWEAPDHTDDAFMVIAGDRYCLTRSSYAPGLCQDWLLARWAGIGPQTQMIVLRDIAEHLEDARRGILDMDHGQVMGWAECLRRLISGSAAGVIEGVRRDGGKKVAEWFGSEP